MIFKKNPSVIHIQKQHSINTSFYRLFTFLITINIFLISCTPTKKILYFQNLPEDTVLHNLVTKDFELKIKKGDVINIGVSSLSTESSGIFTAPQTSAGGSATTAAVGFLVDKNGDILYPKLGVIHVEGLTRDELKNRLLNDLLPYLKEPIVTVSFLNHKVIFMGELNGVVPMPTESMTIFEAISLSGGIPKTARKDNLLVIREIGTDKQFKRLNLDNSSVLYSPFFYLRPDDIVYVEPSKNKGGTNTQQIISYVTAGISFIFLILSRIK